MTNKPILILILLSVVAGGCKKSFLSPEQKDLVYNEVYWKTSKDAERGVLGVYSLYRGLMVNAQLYNRGDVTTGLINKGWNGGSDANLYQPGDFTNISGTQKSWGAMESYADWNGFYKVVAQDNLVITHLEGMSESLFTKGQKASLLGEAYFLRALVYYNIACIWGDAPLLTQSIESSTQVITTDNTLVNTPRSTDMEVLGQVLDDAGKAVANMDYGTPGTDAWGIRANKGSAEALSGYANLWMAFLKKREGQPFDMNITNAVTALEDLVTNGHYSLASYGSADAVLAMFKGKSSEAVFELNISADQNESYRVDQGGIEFLTCKLPPLDGDVTK
ncbi:MAG: RagB/SusD family nutrient uptake outer membrane protein, partial [Bacteroidota bacterium]